ncbi:MAG: hypothetical protein WDW36_004720 [Sanguina aurantia]
MAEKPEESVAAQTPEGDLPDFEKKHPLEHRWTLWFDNPLAKQTTTAFGQTLRPVHTFATVEDFWCLYNNIRTPGHLIPNATFYLFKEGIEPKWEDAKNINGGCWTVSLNRGGSSKQQIDAWWLNSVMATIGEQFTEGDEICGVAVNIRQKGDRIEMWTRTSSNEAAQTSIGKQLRQFLDIPDSQRIGFSVFAEKLTSSKAKDKYMV